MITSQINYDFRELNTFTKPIIHLIYKTKFCIRIVLTFSWDDYTTHWKLKTILKENFGG